jgi:hypothetical protein
MRILQRVMLDNIDYTSVHQHAYEALRMYDTPDYAVRLCAVPGNDPRPYNLPTADEAGVVLPGDDTFQGNHRDIVLHLRPEYCHNRGACSICTLTLRALLSFWKSWVVLRSANSK